MSVIKFIFTFCICAIPFFGHAVARQPNTTEVQYFVVYAYNLPNRDGAPDLNDPFLQIKNSAGTEVYRSPTQDNVASPVFDNVYFNVLSSELYSIEVRDHDSFGTDDSLGSVAVRGERLVGPVHQLNNPVGGSIEFLWKNPTQPPTTTTRSTTTTRPPIITTSTTVSITESTSEAQSTIQTTTTRETSTQHTTKGPDCESVYPLPCSATKQTKSFGFIAIMSLIIVALHVR